MINWPEDVVEDIARRRCVLYLGSGVSANSVNEKGETPATWGDFLNSVIENKKGTLGEHYGTIKELIREKDFLLACEVLASAVEGQNLCKECAAKIDLPDGVFNSMTLDDFREYIKCYDANKPLRDSFTETYRYDFGFFKGSLVLDMDHQLLRLGVVDGAFAMEPSDIKSFRILEDGEVLYEGEKGNFRSYKSNIKERLDELKPRIDEYRMLRHQYEMMEEMRRNMEDSRRDDNFRRDDPDYRDRMTEPDFNIPNPVEKFAVEITLEHPYWKSFYKETGAPKFNSDQPSTIDYLDDYTQKTEGLHALAQNLMQIIDPQVQEQVIDLHAATQSTQSVPQAAPVQAEDPIVALPKYKALLDAGVITAEEFEAKKKQLLGL